MSDALDGITVADLAHFGCNQATISRCDPSGVGATGISTAAIAAAVAEARGYLASFSKGPFATVDSVVKSKICQIAAFEMIATAGEDPSLADNDRIRLRAESARSWFLLVARGVVIPGLTVEEPTTPTSEATGSNYAMSDVQVDFGDFRTMGGV